MTLTNLFFLHTHLFMGLKNWPRQRMSFSYWFVVRTKFLERTMYKCWDYPALVGGLGIERVILDKYICYNPWHTVLKIRDPVPTLKSERPGSDPWPASRKNNRTSLDLLIVGVLNGFSKSRVKEPITAKSSSILCRFFHENGQSLGKIFKNQVPRSANKIKEPRVCVMWCSSIRIRCPLIHLT